MKRLKLFFACLLMAVLSIGQVWAADPVASQAPANGKSYVVAAYVSSKYYALPNTTSNGSTLTGVEVTLDSDGKVSAEDAEGKTWTLTEGSTSGQFLFSYTSGTNTYYLYKNGTGKTNYNFKVSTGNQNYWTFTANGTGYTVAAYDRGTNNVNIQCDNGTFRCYSTASAIILLPIASDDPGPACSSEITITKADNPANGTFVIDNSGAVCIDEGNATVNVTATPNAGYHLATVTSTVGTVGDIDGNNCAITNISANTTINVTFAANPKYTVSFNVGGSSASQADITEESAGAGITLPAGPTPTCSADGWTFAGWAAAAVASETTTAPTLLSGTYHPTANVTLYAVYKRSEGAVFDGTEGGDFYIYAEISGTKYYATAFAKKPASTTDVNSAVKYTFEKIVENEKTYFAIKSGDNYLSYGTSGTDFTFTGTDPYKWEPAAGTQGTWRMKATTGSGRSIVYRAGSTNAFAPYASSNVNGTEYFDIEIGAGTTYYLSAPSCCTPHAITIASGIENGTVLADPTSACEDATVTLTFTPAGGYHLDSWSVNGTEQDVAENTFTMPATAVTVSAIFEHDPCDNLAAPTLDGEIAKTYNSATIAWNEVADAEAYAVSVVKDGEAEPVFSGNVNALSKALENLEPETQYNYTIMAIGDGTVECADGNGLLEGNFTTNPLPQVQLWLVEKQGAEPKNGGTHALGVEFDIPASTLECSKVFRGWTTEAYKDYTHATDAPAVLMNKYTFESETAVTLYAVYADETPGAATLTKLGSTYTPAAGDNLVIVAVVDENTSYALYQETSGSSYVKYWAFDNNVATVAADAKKYVTLADATDGKFYLGDATNGYVYSSSSNNLSVSESQTAWAISWDGEGFKFNQGRYLSCRSDLASPNTYLYRLAGSTPAGIYSFDVYKYALSASTYSNYATTCSNLLDNPTFSLDPVVAPVNDKYEDAINVVITNNAGEGTIYYTTNGENPTSASDEYTAPIALNTCGTKTVKAIVISTTNHSEVVTATYEMAIPIPAVSEADPYTEAEAVEVYNSGCYNNEDVYVTGTVQTAQFYSSNTYTITLTNGFQFYYFYESFDGENLVPFENDYIVAGDVLVAKGKLGKHNTTYQIANGYLVSRTPASKTPIDSDIDNPISVAAALNYIDNAATYDLSEDEFVAGIVESIAECSQHEGTYDIIVLDATDNTKQIKFFGCDVKTFAGIKQYDQITGKGKLFKYYSTYELNYPCEVVALTPYVAPAVSVTGVEVDATASVQVGKTVQLTATVTPDNATNKNVTWSVKAGGEDYAEVSATGLVTGKAEGEAIIVVTTEDGSFTDECTVTINPVPYWATVYTSNVTCVASGDYYETGSKVIISGNEYDAQKVGSSSNTGMITVTVPAYTHTLHFHVFTWNNQTVTLNVTSDDLTNLSANEISVAGDPAGSGSKTYTINSNPVDHYQYITFDPVATEAQITFSRKEGDKRFIMYGINQEGGVLPVLDHIVITGDATELEYEVGDVFIPAGLGVDAYYTLAGNPIAEPEHLVVDENWSGWSVTPAILTGETTSVTVTATYEGKTDSKDVDITVNVPVTPEIVVNPNAIAFGKVNQNAIVGAEGISVTLKSVATATVALTGDGAAAFSIDKAALSELNSTITVTPVTTTVGTFAATITISDDANAAEAKEIALSMTVEAVEDLSGTWVVAKSVAAGDRIIIGATYQGNTKTMGAQNDNNRAAVASTYENLVLTPAEGTKTFTLVDAGDGKFAIRALNGKYLAASGTGTKNYLTEADDYTEDNAKWTVSIDNEGVASVVALSNNRNDLQYNNGNTIFSCYSTDGQKPINIYKIGTPDYGSYNRNDLTPGNYATICLPNGGTISGATLFDLDYYDGASTLYLLEVNGNEMVAGRPYVFLPSGTSIEVTYTDNVNAAAGSYRGLVGSYTEETVAIGTGDEANYILWKNAYYLVNSEAYVGANRAYIHMAGVLTVPSTPQAGQAPRRRVAMTVHGTQTATGMDELNASQAPVKVIIDGQLFIIRGEQMFNANGQLVK